MHNGSSRLSMQLFSVTFRFLRHHCFLIIVFCCVRSDFLLRPKNKNAKQNKKSIPFLLRGVRQLVDDKALR